MKNYNGEERMVILPLSSDRLRKVARAMSNQTAMKIIGKLLEGSMSATKLAETLSIPLTTVKYNIDALLEAELIKVKYVGRSQKGREVKYYAPVKRTLVLIPEKTEKGVLTFLKKALVSVLVVAFSIPLALTLQHIWVGPSQPGGGLPTTEAGLWLWFITGTTFALIARVVIHRLLHFLRKKPKQNLN